MNPLKSSHFSDYLSSSQIVFNVKAKEKIGALEELLDVLEKQKLIKNKKPILTRIIDRERLESTGIGHGVALPHARVDTGHDIAVVVGRAEEGIDFDAIDNQNVRLIILIVWNPAIPGLFNHLFAGLAKFLIQPSFRSRLFDAKSASELYKVLSEIELQLPQPDDHIIHRAGLLWKLQEIEMRKKKADKKELKELQSQAELIRTELDTALIDRFDRFIERYGFAVAEVEDGVCQGCYINVATGMGSAIEGTNDIYICENCGKFLVAAKKTND
jgi:mannitol/fructose-specific phosphotransferase system IIA component (Ntr-type)